jgi:methylenetetrahydrofolate dehydrogenase (NADP+) / methenyltetrahydrofolate cyclohydrolase
VKVLAGRQLALDIKTRAAEQAADLAQSGVDVTLAVVVATGEESTHWYVRSITGAATKAGIGCRVIDLGTTATEDQIGAQLDELSNDPRISGIILQTPLPLGVSAARLVSRIVPHKDIDGANPMSLGRLAVGEPAFAPATAQSVVELLDHHQIPAAGRHVAVVGRSNVVGKPLLHLLLQRNATVTACHSRSKPLSQFTRPADIVVAAVGHAGLLTADHVSAGAVVIDVGTNVLADGTLVGDADYDSVSTVASAASPVPGGVGSVTTALLLLHAVEAAANKPALAPV